LGRGHQQRRVQGAGEPVVGAVAPSVVVVLTAPFSVVVFDLDGTLLDSDAALAAPYVALGVPSEDVTFGHVVEDECARLGLAVDDYLRLYDVSAAMPFDGVDVVVRSLDRWAVCSNKVRSAGVAELARLAWTPEVAMFADDFGGASKRLGPVLAAMGVRAAEVVFVGDTNHDRVCASDAGVAFALAAWNPRAAGLAVEGDIVLEQPADLLRLLAGQA
jgi:HAD superfamily hydrolase (TIGR01549 family)